MNKTFFPVVPFFRRQVWQNWILPFLACTVVFASAQTNEDCMACHSDPALVREEKKTSVAVNEKNLLSSIHGKQACLSCHTDLKDSEFPHKPSVNAVECGFCHKDISTMYGKSLHGIAVAKKIKLAPSCKDCHGSHAITKINAPNSKVSRFNIPFVCGSCHREGSPVSKTFKIPQDSILEHYSENIHGESLFKRGLSVTAVCTDCHTAHNVLPHTDPGSSIYRGNVSKTCEKCHSMIEKVHRKIINRELWEKSPKTVPVCVDCHEPHEIRKNFYDQGMADRDCLLCHSKKNLSTVRDGKKVSLTVDSTVMNNSVHRNIGCSQCHTKVNPSLRRPCESVKTKVDCSICHNEVVKEYETSIHGILAERGDTNAPVCATCHGTHEIRQKRDPLSKTYPTQVYQTCNICHNEGEKAALRYKGTQHDIITNYTESIHGKGLLKSGLLVTAMCTDCHTAHHVLPRDNAASSVNHANLPETCGKCHGGIFKQFEKSIHSPLVNKTDKHLPSCSDCHQSHAISRTDQPKFGPLISKECGHCHEEVVKTYFDTYHGKVSKLGGTTIAKCNDCHGAHNILSPSDPHSTLSHKNIVATCGKCHPGSNRKFAGYLTHATHHDKGRYPVLFYTYWFMVILLSGTLTFFGIHTLLWLPRSFAYRKKMKNLSHGVAGEKQYQRFGDWSRRLHILVIVSFLSLAITGMVLKFSYMGWAQKISQFMGGFETAGFIHRVAAIVTFFYFFMHLVDVVRKKNQRNVSWFEFLLGPNSMIPNWTDLKEALGSVKWFLGMGQRPLYGRYTYWEKFDYFAVFWGVLIIGSSGLLLWFPEFFTRFFPGWMINIATIVHSDEALLATAFIFTIHFFNTHFRPEKFPMDTVIFTGRMSVEELKHERPREYEEMLKSGELEKKLVEPLPPDSVRNYRIFGTLALLTGIAIILLILWTGVFGYR